MPGLDQFWLILFYLFISVALVDSQIDAYWLVYLWCTELVHGC